MGLVSLIWFSITNYSQWVIELLTEPAAWVGFVIIYMLYKKTTAIQKVMYNNKVKYSTWNMFISASFFGLIAGLVGTIIITVLGITFYKYDGIQYIIILSLFLMIIDPHFVCLSYSGGILSIISLLSDKFANTSSIFTFINKYLNFDVTALMAIIAIMHLIESLLMMIDGNNSSVPIFIKKDDSIVGAFVMQRYWFLPVLFYAFLKNSGVAGEVFQTPNWWPIIKPNISKSVLDTLIVSAIPIFAVLGYGDFAVSETPNKKVKRSSIGLLLFSFALFGLAFLSSKIYIFKYIAAIFASLCHEALIIYERRIEFKRKPVFVHKDDGVMVFDTLPGAPSETMGLKCGDIIISINNKAIKTLKDINTVLSEGLSVIWIKAIGIDGNEKTFEYSDYKDGIKGLGILTIPQIQEGLPIIELKQQHIFSKLFKKKE